MSGARLGTVMPDYSSINKKLNSSPEQKKQALKQMLGYLRKHWVLATLSMFATLLGLATDVISPYFTGKVINLIIQEEFETVKQYCLYVFLICLVSCHCLIV